MQKLKGFSKRIGIALLSFIGAFIIYLIVSPFLIGFAYNFSEPAPFQGDQFYNPYHGLDSKDWKKANFHAHSHNKWGLNGYHHEELAEIQAKYKELGYEIANVSEYMFIDKTYRKNDSYVPCYEHGYSFQKTHQIVLGASQVNYIDYMLYAFTSNKQYVLNKLNQSSKAVALAHPSLLNGYTKNDIKYLNNYQLFEAVSRFAMSLELWDHALSWGKPVFIIANDDMHDITDPNEVAQVCTVVNVKELNEDNIIDALKSGQTYGLEMRRNGLNWDEKKAYVQNYTKLESVLLNENTVQVQINKPIQKIRFIGQNGQVLKSTTFSANDSIKSAFYPITESDTYIRTEITTFDGHKAYLNPIYRYSDDPFAFSNIATINWPLTILFKLIPFVFGGTIIYLIRRRRVYKKRRKVIPKIH